MYKAFSGINLTNKEGLLKMLPTYNMGNEHKASTAPATEISFCNFFRVCNDHDPMDQGIFNFGNGMRKRLLAMMININPIRKFFNPSL